MSMACSSIVPAVATAWVVISNAINKKTMAEFFFMRIAAAGRKEVLDNAFRQRCVVGIDNRPDQFIPDDSLLIEHESFRNAVDPVIDRNRSLQVADISKVAPADPKILFSVLLPILIIDSQ